MNMKKKIGWQKYETLLEEQMTSPLLTDLIKQSMSNLLVDDDYEEEETYKEDEADDASIVAPVPINSKMLEDVAMMTNFDCWLGHTNFDITPDIKRKLNKVGGIEVLKIISRYRFFIGVGKMFEFKSVRGAIEEQILT
jgi:hypothetical protein